MTFLYEHFKQTYTPPATTITFTYENEEESTYVFEPHALAAISSLFRNIPPPPNGTFEINQQGIIKTHADAQWFLAMCKVPSQHWKIESEWEYTSFYAASRLCDFLGIEAEPVLKYCYKHYTRNLLWKDEEAVAIRVVLHQICIRTNNQHDKRYIERVILQACWEKHGKKDLLEYDCSVGEDPHERSELINLHNDTQYALSSLYYLFILCCNAPSITAVSSFMMAKLGWSGNDNPYGYILQ